MIIAVLFTALSPPTDLVIVSHNETSIDMEWTATLGHSDGYLVICDGYNGAISQNFVIVDPSVTTATCSDLTSGAHYGVHVETMLSDNSAIAAASQTLDVVTGN